MSFSPPIPKQLEFTTTTKGKTREEGWTVPNRFRCRGCRVVSVGRRRELMKGRRVGRRVGRNPHRVILRVYKCRGRQITKYVNKTRGLLVENETRSVVVFLNVMDVARTSTWGPILYCIY